MVLVIVVLVQKVVDRVAVRKNPSIAARHGVWWVRRRVRGWGIHDIR